MYSPQAPARQRKESATSSGKPTVRKAGFGQINKRRPRAENPEGPEGGGKEGGPGRRQRWGCQERAGSPQEESWEARLGPGRAAEGGGGTSREGASPWAMGQGGMGRRGPVTVPARRPLRTRSPRSLLTWARSWTSSGPPPRWHTGSSAREPGCGLAPGRREARSPRPPRRPWKWRWTRTRRRRPPPRWTRTTRWPGPAWGALAAAAVAAAAVAAAAGTGRPQSPAGHCHPRRLRDHRPSLRVPPWPSQE